MTKEPIIIDGVDVSGCNFTLERDGKIKCECTHATGFGVICDCESWKTCDYKNYKRKEQELNQYIQPIIDRLLKQFETYDKLKSLDVVTFAKQTFEQLDQLKGKMTAQEIDQSIYIKQLEKTINRIRTERDNYKQNLQEIKKITETLKTDICSYCDSKDTDRCDQTDTDELQQIIQICKGALNE